VRIYRGSDPDTGRRRYSNHTIQGTKKDAEKYLNAQLRSKDLGVFVEPARISLGTFLDRWLEDAVRPRVRPRTLEGYRRWIDGYVRPALGEHRLDQIRPVDVQRLYGTIRSPHAVAHVHRPLKSAFEQAVRWGMLARNPAEGVSVPSEPRREMCCLSAVDVGRFQAAAAGVPRAFVLTFTLATGMRPGEVQALRWADVDLVGGRVAVRRALVHLKGGRWEFGEPKTRGSRRTIPLPRSVARDLVAYREAQLVHRQRVGNRYEDLDLVFAGERGRPLDAQNLAYRTLKPILRAAGLPTRFRWYDCRHTCATLLLAAGENPKVVSERLGHSTVAFTLDRYAHVLPGMQEGAAERLEAVLTRPAPEPELVRDATEEGSHTPRTPTLH
jgi:integrase